MKTPPLILNAKWRVVDDLLQWILQVRSGRERAKASGWRARSWCASRGGLLRCVTEYCGDVDPDALAVIEAFPEMHEENPGAVAPRPGQRR